MTVLTLGAHPEKVILYVYAGDVFEVRFYLYDSDGDPATLTGYTAESQVRLTALSSLVIVEFTTDIDDNAITLSLTDSETSDLSSGLFDLQITDSDGVPTTLVYGDVRVKQDITHD